MISEIKRSAYYEGGGNLSLTKSFKFVAKTSGMAVEKRLSQIESLREVRLFLEGKYGRKEDPGRECLR